MKKKFFTILFLCLCICLCSCGKSDAAKAVDNQIAAIGEITLNSEAVILQAEEAAKSLSEEDHAQLDRLDDLANAWDCFYSLQAAEVEKQIAKINTDSPTCEEDTVAARSTYDESSDSVKEKVSNLSLLENAEVYLVNLHTQNVEDLIRQIGEVTLERSSLVTKANSAYWSLTKEERAQISNYDVLEKAILDLSDLKVESTIHAIENMGPVTLANEEKINEVQTVYNLLKKAEKEKVTNRDVLEKATNRLRELKQEEADREKARVLSSLSAKTDKVTGITWYQPRVFPTYINSRSMILPYLGHDDYSTWLRLRLNYAGNSWIFFESVIISVDGNNYYKQFDYFDVIRDNGGGTVGEYVDFAPSSDDITMLKAIADSTETIVRFQGDTQYYDLTVNSSDKAAIKDVLAAYDILRRS